VLQGCYSLLLQDEHGQIQETHSVSAGLDYPGVGPEHALLAASGASRTRPPATRVARGARRVLRAEGILPAIESAHALPARGATRRQHRGSRILIGLSGRGDKDMPTLQRTLLKGTS
jgi:tryptophan synthase beta chain